MPQRLTYTVTEAAEILGISKTSAYECVQRGETPSLAFEQALDHFPMAPESSGRHDSPSTLPPPIATVRAKSAHRTLSQGFWSQAPSDRISIRSTSANTEVRVRSSRHPVNRRTWRSPSRWSSVSRAESGPVVSAATIPTSAGT